MTLAYLPSPVQGVWHLGPIPIRAYALCIIAGIVVAIWLTQRRWTARGGKSEDVVDVALWAVPFGIVGGRLYHVITDPELYFLPGRDPLRAFFIWDGGLGIWGRSPSAQWVPGLVVDAAASTCWTSATPWRRAWYWPRRSADGETTSTKNSLDVPRPCRGHWRSIPPTALLTPR